MRRMQTLIKFTYAVLCDDGDLRLVGGESESEGRLDICFSQRWGTINGDGWSSSDTQVACRQLGFENAGKLIMLCNAYQCCTIVVYYNICVLEASTEYGYLYTNHPEIISYVMSHISVSLASHCPIKIVLSVCVS